MSYLVQELYFSRESGSDLFNFSFSFSPIATIVNLPELNEIFNLQFFVTPVTKLVLDKIFSYITKEKHSEYDGSDKEEIQGKNYL